MRRMVSAVLVLLVAAAAAPAVPRTWEDETGTYKIRAEFVRFEDGKVFLRRVDDGREVAVPLERLSEFDQLWVEQELERREADIQRPASPAPPTPRPPDAPVAPVDVAPAAPARPAAYWPQWRGPNRDGKSIERGLLSDWRTAAPRLLWSADNLGRGYASVAVVGDRIYTAGRRGNAEMLICLSADGGRELWATPFGGGSHTNGTPTVDGDLVFCIGLSGDLICADAATGRELWRKNFGRDFGGRMMSGWGFSESPLVDGDRLICTPGGDRAVMVALEKRTGRPIWSTPMPPGGTRGKDGAGYASVVISNAGGVKQYVQLVGRGVIGVAAENGQFLWGYDKIANDTANIPTPIPDGDFIFCSSGYGTGAALLQIGRAGRQIVPQELYFLGGNILQNHHGGMILHEGYVYCGHGNNQGHPVCLNLRTGRPAWGPLRGAGGGSAAVTYADGHLYFRYEDGTMALIEATPEAYRLKGTFRIASNHDKSWPHPAIADGKLYLRDQHQLHCYDIRQR